MKKLISAVLSAAMTLSAVAAPTVSAENKQAGNSSDGRSFVVLGDSIGSGYGLGAGEYDYGELIADYYGGTVSNFAHAGDDTDDLLALLASPTAEMSAALENADDVLISIGGNNMIYYAANQLLQICANIGVLSEGYTAADIPEEPTFNDLFAMIDTDALKEFASSLGNQMKLSQEVQRIRAHLEMTQDRDTDNKYRRIIETEIIPDIETIVYDIKAVNPDANIVVQTVYDPLQFEKSYYEATYTGATGTFMNMLIPVFTIVTESFRDQLIGAAIDGVTVADIYDEFTSLDADGNKYSWYFTKIQNERKDMDFHPTQAGHVAIAARIIDTLGVKDNSGRLIVNVFEGLSDKQSYPAAALDTYQRVTMKLGDPNNDGYVNSSDASFVLTAYGKLSTGINDLTDAEYAACDVNKDTKVDSSDASLILAYYAYLSIGGEDSFEDYIAANVSE